MSEKTIKLSPYKKALLEFVQTCVTGSIHEQSDEQLNECYELAFLLDKRVFEAAVQNPHSSLTYRGHAARILAAHPQSVLLDNTEIRRLPDLVRMGILLGLGQKVDYIKSEIERAFKDDPNPDIQQELKEILEELGG